MSMVWTDGRAPNAAGSLDANFNAVGDAFVANFSEGLELGAAFAVVIDNELVVDIRAGHADKAKEQAWSEETLACIYSSGKAVVSLLIAKAVSDGLLNYDAPVVDYWPEFGAAGKDKLTVAQLLSHQGGLCGFAEDMPPQAWLDKEGILRRLEAMTPLWTPGSASGYHPQTFGFMAEELLRRVTGKPVSALIAPFQQQIFCGLTPSEIARAAFMPKPPKAPDLGELNEFTKIAFLKKWSALARVAREEWMAAEFPASNMHADARSLAMIMHPFVNGGMWGGDPLLTEDAIEGALAERIVGDDLVLPFHLSWSAGLMKNINGHFGPNESAYGHAGFGGSCVVVDPQNRLTAAYVMSKMSPHLVGDPRGLRMINAVYDAL